MGSIAIFLAGCTNYDDVFEDNFGYGQSTKGVEFSGSTLKDLRDNHTYEVAKVGSLYWMMQDLSYEYYSTGKDYYLITACPKQYTNDVADCDETGFLYPGQRLEHACPAGWRLPDVDEWQNFYNSSTFKNSSRSSYKGYIGGDKSQNKYGEAAYYWANTIFSTSGYKDCVSFTSDDNSFEAAGLCHEQWKMSVRCVLDADSANASPSSSEQNDEEQEYDCSVTDGVKVVYPEGGETFALGDIVTVIFGSDLEGGFGIELRSADGTMKAELLDVDGEIAVADGKTCMAYDVALNPSYGVWTTDSTNDNKVFINVYSYLKPSKNAKSGTFDITFFKQEIPDETIVDVAIEPCRIDGEDACLYDSFTDERDGQRYKTVLVGKTLWMAENLRYENGGSCYNGSSAMCDKYGRLYTWGNAESSCPIGWRLPTKNDVESLMSSVGGIDIAGAKLMALEGWVNNNGTDEYGLAMLPGGFGADDEFAAEGERAFFWTSTGFNSSVAYSLVLLGEDDAYMNLSDKNLGYSIRCVWDR